MDHHEAPECRECATECQSVGSFYLCPNRECDRYAIPVNEQGLTENEESSQDATGARR